MTVVSLRASVSRFLGWGVLAFGVFSGMALQAQSYQTQFAEVKPDRAKGPATWHGGVSVDNATGALNADIPLGPGIGNRGIHFAPRITGSWAPKAKVEDREKVYTPQQCITLLKPGSFSFSPGYLDYFIQETATGGITFQLPDGSSSTIIRPDRVVLP